MSKLFFIAGEPSGDLLGASLITALREKNPNVKIEGIGGDKMIAAGLPSLFPMHELSVMGLAEILPHLLRLRQRLNETVASVLLLQPDAVITIDSPGFTFRVAKQLRTQGYTGKLIHFVAPSVWAWRPKRAQKTAALFDALLCLLPFEPPYFEKHGLPTTFVGHPVLHTGADKGNAAAFRANHKLTNDIPLLCLLPGSRRGELKRHLPIFAAVMEQLYQDDDTLRYVLPTLPHLKPLVEKFFAGRLLQPIITHDSYDAMAASTVALAASGTVTLETALAKLPTVVTYKVNPVTAAIAKKLVRIPSVSLINIIAQLPILPEYIQERARPDWIAGSLQALRHSPSARQAQLQQAQAVLQSLYPPQHPTAATAAATAILNQLGP